MSTRVRFMKLRISSPAPTTSVTASAISATTSAERIQTRAAPAVVRVLDSRIAWLALAAPRWSSGTSAKISPVTTATTSVKPSTVRSTVTSAVLGMAVGLMAMSACNPT